MVHGKLKSARFLGLLNYRHRQLNSMTRQFCVFAIGNSLHEDEFKRRVRYIYDAGLSNLFTKDKHTGEEVMTATNLRKAIAALGDVDLNKVPRGDVHDLLERYDTNLNGMDLVEFTSMLQDLIDTRTLFTDFENLDDCSTTQLHALKAHDWHIPFYDCHTQRDMDRDEELSQLSDQESFERGRERRTAGSVHTGVKTIAYKPLRERIERVKELNMSHDELVHWCMFQAEKLDRKGKLLIQPRTWVASGYS